MTLALAALAGFLTGRLCWFVMRPTFAHTPFLRENHRGRWIPTAAGLVLPVALVVVEAGRAVAGAAGIGSAGPLGGARALVLLSAVGFGLAGLLDDLVGTGDARGFRGHLGALGRGRLTTGGLKLVVGGAVALVVCAPVDGGHVPGLLRDAALVALAANLGNLLDRRPGRTLKAAVLAFAALGILASRRPPLTGVAVVIGAALSLVVDDLHEHLMLGDTGANVLGGAVGLGVVLGCAPATRLGVLVAVAALNGLSELVSFGRVIDAVAPLRAFDRWGTRPPDRAGGRQDADDG